MKQRMPPFMYHDDSDKPKPSGTRILEAVMIAGLGAIITTALLLMFAVPALQEKIAGVERNIEKIEKNMTNLSSQLRDIETRVLWRNPYQVQPHDPR
jgi:hypothetical protein